MARDQDEKLTGAILGMYAAVAAPSQHWDSLSSLGDFLDAADVDCADLLDQHGEKIHQLARSVRPSIEQSTRSRFSKFDALITKHGRLIELSERFGEVFAGELPEHYSDLPTTPSAISQIKATIMGARTKPLVLPIFSGNEQVTRLVKLFETFDKENLALQIIETELPDSLRSVLREQFEITEAEFDVLSLLVSGNTLSEVAKLRQRSSATVRRQVKSLIAKLFVANQAGLVSRALTLAKNDVNDSEMASEGNILELNDEERVQYFVFGPASERKVLFFYHAIDGPIPSIRFQNALYKFGIELIVVARAGCGATTAKAFNSPLESFAHSSFLAKSVLRTLGITECDVISAICGLPFALHFASSHSQKVRCVHAYNPFPPFDTYARRKHLPGRWKIYAHVCRLAPRLGEAVLALSFNQALINPYSHARKMIADDLGKEADENLLADLTETQVRNFALTSANKAIPLLREGIAYCASWDTKLGRNYEGPQIQMFQGEGPFSLPNSLLEGVAKNLKSASVRILPGAKDPTHKCNPDLMFRNLTGR
jgi:DNA-binding CsgD family transcriptional regulator